MYVQIVIKKGKFMHHIVLKNIFRRIRIPFLNSRISCFASMTEEKCVCFINSICKAENVTSVTQRQEIDHNSHKQDSVLLELMSKIRNTRVCSHIWPFRATVQHSSQQPCRVRVFGAHHTFTNKQNLFGVYF